VNVFCDGARNLFRVLVFSRKTLGFSPEIFSAAISINISDFPIHSGAESQPQQSKNQIGTQIEPTYRTRIAAVGFQHSRISGQVTTMPRLRR